jgi:hypothetical protein
MEAAGADSLSNRIMCFGLKEMRHALAIINRPCQMNRRGNQIGRLLAPAQAIPRRANYTILYFR